MAIFVGVDVGGTTSTVAIGHSDRRVLKISNQFPTRSEDGPVATVGDIVAQILVALIDLKASPSEVTSISLATPGPATADGILLTTPNLDARMWDRCPIRQRLQDAFSKHAANVPVAYIGDGQAAALGEFAVRTGSIVWNHSPLLDKRDTFHSLFMVVVGTGLGGGEVRDGQTVRGSQGRAGHAGHLMLPMEAFRHEHDRQLKVGNAFCTAESAVSFTSLTHQLSYRLKLDAWKLHPLNELGGSDKDKAKQLREYASAGDPLTLELLDDQAKALGMTLLMINYIGDYDRLVIGGGVCEMADAVRKRYLKNVEKAYFDHALDGFRTAANFSFSACGDSASVIGSLCHAYDATSQCKTG